MNQLFYNIVGGIVHQIRREKRTTISEISNKIEIGFISIFLLKARVLNSKFGEHERSVRVARGVAEGNSSFLSALQTSQVLHNSIVHS